MLEIFYCYYFNKSSVKVLVLDVSTAFDRVKHCKLFAVLLKRDISPIILRLLFFMYTHQALRVMWGNTLSEQCVKQGKLFSPIFLLCNVYTEGLLERLENTGIRCHMGS